MADVRARTAGDGNLTPLQRDSLWKWRWLGLRDSTPAFKACLVLAAAVLFALIAYALVPLP
jgi:hypothetical protein